MSKKIIKDTLVLVAIVLIAAVCLSLVYETTKDRIAEAEAEERLESFRKVFEGAADFEDREFEYPASDDGITVTDALYVKDKDGNNAGCVVSVTNPNGYGGDIVMSLGFDTDGRITGMTVTSMSETAGLGAKCQDGEWQAQFAGLSSFPIVYTKNSKTAPNEIDALSGATVTTKAITNSVNYAADFVRSVFGYGGQ
ncbi:MAG: RnfABCDGE type electron transport complex subunit G [Clostridia bacterium]|nr:RnfABCDGE type electron transport complex subunit G [Clostridia bacterium]